MINWYVWLFDFNNKKIVPFNIFSHTGFLKDCQAALRKFGRDRKEFEERVLQLLIYYFWSKCEYEVIVSGCPPTKDGKEAKKIDAYDQVLVNSAPFLEYLWNHKDELKRCKL